MEGSTATYTCDSGFGLASGDATLTCVSGIWTGTPPTCAGMCIIHVYMLGESLGAHESPQFPRIMHTKAHTLTYTFVYVHVCIMKTV